MRRAVATTLKSTWLPVIRSTIMPIGNMRRNAVVSASTGKTLARSTVLREPPARDEA
jgi:hypothetical protein